MESKGTFSLAGHVEMAWIMGLIKYRFPVSGSMPPAPSGWIETSSGEPIDDWDIKVKYEKQILEHSGIKIIEPRACDGSDPQAKELLHEVLLQEDLPRIVTSTSAAEEFQRIHGDKVEISSAAADGHVSVRFKAGATIFVPKASNFDHFVGGQLPQGWDPLKYGLLEDIVAQVDRVTLYVLICTVEAFLSAGVTDVYELYKHIHVSEVANCVGSGVGGFESLRALFKQRFKGHDVQKDIFAESFINTPSAWVNMLLLSASGPIKTPAGACATALESIDAGYDLITSKKAKLCLVGGCEDLTQDVANEFANMRATTSARADLERGRVPSEMSRPTCTSRQGFVQSEGCGIQILTSAKLALEMGLPIYGVIAATQMAGDKIGRSVPAPGQGILTAARQVSGLPTSPLLDPDVRKRRLDASLAHLEQRRCNELDALSTEADALTKSHPHPAPAAAEHLRQRRLEIDLATSLEKDEMRRVFGSQFWKQDSTISPIIGGLAVFGLGIDDITFASFHGTSTSLNDTNECSVFQKQMSHLGRHAGSPIYGIFQKWLTGHPLGAAGAWMLNGALQICGSGLLPGNRNADNIDDELRRHDHLVFPSRTLTAFGFGQKGAQVIGVHPRYVLGAVAAADYRTYAQRRFQEGVTANSLFVAKEVPPYGHRPDALEAFLLDPMARYTGALV